jgi:hypothetical protein
MMKIHFAIMNVYPTDENCPPPLSTEDFDLFWEFLTYKRQHQIVMSDYMPKRAATSEIIRLFKSLNIFDNENQTESFVTSWRSLKPDTISCFELKMGLARFSQQEYTKFYSVIIHLQEKQEKDKLRAHAIVEDYQRKENERRDQLEKERKQKLKDDSLIGRIGALASKGFSLKNLFPAHAKVSTGITIVAVKEKKKRDSNESCVTLCESKSSETNE